MIQFISGDLFDLKYDFDAVAHGVNTMGVMGAGIATRFKELYPEMYRKYREYCKSGLPEIGSVFVWCEPSDKIILNLFTQDSDGYRIMPATYEAIQESLEAMTEYIETVPFIKKVGMPTIGCGLGGLEWKKVKEIIQNTCDSPKFSLIVFEKYSPK